MNSTSPSSPISSELEDFKLYDLFNLKLPLFAYEAVNRISPSAVHNFVEILSDVHQRLTRQARKGDIFMTRHSTVQCGESSIRYTGAKSWNKIPANIIQFPSVMSFGRQLKLHMFSMNYQSINLKIVTILQIK